MAALQKFNVLSEDLAKGVHHFNSDTFKILLTNTLPVATNAVKTDITEIAAGGGYAAGGIVVAVTLSRTGAVTKITLADTILPATGAIATFRYAVCYNDTSPSDSLVGWADRGATATPAAGETVTFDFDNTNGALTIT